MIRSCVFLANFESGLCFGHLPDVARPFCRTCGIIRIDMIAISTLSLFEVGFGREYDAAVAGGKAVKMGLDAFAACNCLRDGKLSDPPEPFTMDDVYRNAEGLISSRMLGCFLEQLGYEEYWRRYGALDRRFYDWADDQDAYERTSMIFTTNNKITQWVELMGDQTLTTALLDRILDHARCYSLRGESYRLKHPETFAG